MTDAVVIISEQKHDKESKVDKSMRHVFVSRTVLNGVYQR